MKLIKVINFEHDGFLHHLEQPKTGSTKSSGLLIKGWVLSYIPHDFIVKVDDSEINNLSYNETRNDVLKHFNITDSQNKSYGFNHECEFVDSLSIGVICSGVIKWLYLIKIETSIKTEPKVIRGKNNYLFLDNDSNKSVDQYIGKYLIHDSLFDKWQLYFDLVVSRSTNNIMLVVPNKEELFPDFYPFKRSNNTLIDRFLQKFNSYCFYPLQELKQNRELSYMKTDTHWTDYGAFICAQNILKLFGLDAHISKLADKFFIKQVHGDLGSKLVHLESSYCLKSSDVFNASFDNSISNRGLIKIYDNIEAPVNDCLVVFGDSFSFNLVPYLGLIFIRVVYVHTIASTDIELLLHEKPKYVLYEMNQRFIGVAPECINNWDFVKLKLSTREKIELLHLKERMEKYSGGKFDYYASHMLAIINDIYENKVIG